MNDSILTSIKKLLMIDEAYEHFDVDIIIAINTIFGVLCQMGVGPSTGFSIQDKTTTWDEYIGEDTNMEMVKTYIHLRVKMIFDPPQSSAVNEVYNNLIKEMETRLYMAFNPKDTFGGTDDE